MMSNADLERIEQALEKAEKGRNDLTTEECEAIREVLVWWRTWKAWGKLGKIVLWAAITLGAIAAAARETGLTAWFKQ